MGNTQEEEKTLMSIRSAGRNISALLFMDAKIVLALYVFLKRMQQEGILKGGEVLNFEKFMKATEGKFDLMNIPQELRKDTMLQELDELKIRYHVMPELDQKSGTRQVLVYAEDREKFAAWLEQKILSHLQEGGEKTVGQLNRLTDRNTSIVSIPCEGEEALQRLKEDFDRLGINYAQLPDLHAGDGCTQFLIANADMKKVEHWFSLYRDDMLMKGTAPKEMRTVTPEQYLNGSEMTVEDYVASGDEKVQAANTKYEGKAKGEVERMFETGGKQMKSVEHERYERFHRDPDYCEITIDRKTLVENCRYELKPEETQNFFASRIPGTYGKKEQTLILPKDQVFQTMDQKTYLAFVHKKERPIILNASGKVVALDQRETGEELAKNQYDKPMRKAQKSDKTAVEQNQAKDMAKGLAERAPKNPTLTI